MTVVIVATFAVSPPISDADALEIVDTLKAIGAQVQVLRFMGDKLTAVGAPDDTTAVERDPQYATLSTLLRALPARPSLSKEWQARVHHEVNEGLVLAATALVLHNDFAFEEYRRGTVWDTAHANRWAFAIGERLRRPDAGAPVVDVKPLAGNRLTVHALGVVIAYPIENAPKVTL